MDCSDAEDVCICEFGPDDAACFDVAKHEAVTSTMFVNSDDDSLVTVPVFNDSMFSHLDFLTIPPTTKGLNKSTTENVAKHKSVTGSMFVNSDEATDLPARGLDESTKKDCSDADDECVCDFGADDAACADVAKHEDVTSTMNDNSDDDSLVTVPHMVSNPKTYGSDFQDKTKPRTKRKKWKRFKSVIRI